MYLNETDKFKDELAMVIEEFLNQRILGFKNPDGVYVTPAFPKLLYVLEEDNITEGSKYFYLTELAAKCTAKRMVPDYISEKVMKQLKVDANGEGHCYPCMGCVDGEEVIDYRISGEFYKESFTDAWDRLSRMFIVLHQYDDKNPNLYMDLRDVEIFDTKLDKYTECKRIIRNISNNWVEVSISVGKNLVCTTDHPFEIIDKGVVQAQHLVPGDKVLVNKDQYGVSEATIVSVAGIKRKDYSYDVTTASEHFEVSGIYSHNCRSFLTPFIDENGKPKYYGRLNCGVVTINLVDAALSSGGNMDKFWEIMDERTELCHKALRIRYDRVANGTSDVAPLLWQDGAFARLKPGTKIGTIIKNGYATVSLGYAGLYETVLYMTGESHSGGKGKEFGLKVMQYLNDKCNAWKADENIAYSLYGTPIESTTYKFAKNLRRRFGEIKDITDRNYITNSYHINVREEIDAFSKLAIESEYQKLSPGGSISYVEVPNMQDNIPAVVGLIQYIYDNIMYAELNTKSDYCQNCGYDGEIQIKEDENKKLYWECPHCGCHDESKLHVTRRTCGYLGTQFWNQGRTQEIRDRVLHL